MYLTAAMTGMRQGELFALRWRASSSDGRQHELSTGAECGNRRARALALERERWAVVTRCERGYTEQLPDLAVWLDRSEPPGAEIAESGGRREDRQRMLLEGWRDALWSGRYAAVRYDCASPSVAHWLARLAKKVGLAGSAFTAAVQTTAEQIAALSPAAATNEPAVNKPKPSSEPVLAITTEPRRTHSRAVTPRAAPTERARVDIGAAARDSRSFHRARAALP